TNPAALEPLLNNEPAYPGLYRLSLHDALPIYPAADADDVAGGFGQVDEAVRAHLAQLRVVPAHQRLGVEDAAAVQVNLRLVDQVELVVVQRAPQLGLRLQALLLLRRQLGGERLPAVAGAALAGVHRHVGALDQLLGRGAVRMRVGDADTGGDAEFVLAQPEALGEGRLQLPRQPLGAGGVVIGVADHQE